MQPDKSDFILSMIDKSEAHEAKSHCTLMKKSKIKNKQKNKDGNIKTIYPFGLLSTRNSQMED